MAEMAARLSNAPAPESPTEERVAQFQSIEGRVISGTAFAGFAGTTGTLPLPLADQISAPEVPHAAVAPPGEALDSVAGVLPALVDELDPTESRTTGARRSRGRITLKLRVRGTTYHDYRRLERRLCRSALKARAFSDSCASLSSKFWKRALYKEVAYGKVYARDGYRRKNPFVRTGT